jgi:hypothetical protein
LETTTKKGDSALLVVRIPAGSVVPTGKGGFTTTEVDGAIQLRIVVDKVEGTGDDRRVFRQAKVTKETPGLHFTEVKAHPDAELGVFNFVPPYFTRKEEKDRRADNFDVVKNGVYLMHNREYRARKQEEFHLAAISGANLTASQLLLEGTAGSAVVESEWIVKAKGRDNTHREYPRYLRVVLQRDEEGGAIHVVTWSPPPTNHFSPRLGMLQPRRDNLVVPLTVEARMETEGEEPKIFVRFSPKDQKMVEGNGEQARNVIAALRDLAMCSRQALLSEHTAAAGHAEDEPDEKEGEAHRHYWRVDGTCRCGEQNPAASDAS